MTLEGQAPGQDETPAPPARTRWSEEAADDDAGLMPPYVPGGAEAVPSAGTPPAPQPERDPWAGPPEPSEPAAPAGEEPFPFEAADDEPFPFEPAGEETIPPEGGDDEFPFDAFDIGAPDATAAVESEGPGSAPEPFLPASLPAEPAAAPSASADLASRLQTLADALRREGRAGLEREMASGDRFTSLVAGVVAGYLAGLEE